MWTPPKSNQRPLQAATVGYAARRFKGAASGTVTDASPAPSWPVVPARDEHMSTNFGWGVWRSRLPRNLYELGSRLRTGPVTGDFHGHEVAGYGLTECPKEIWDKWYEANRKDSPLIANRLVFAAPGKDAIISEIQNVPDGNRNGLEPIEPPSIPNANEEVVINDPRLKTLRRRGMPMATAKV